MMLRLHLNTAVIPHRANTARQVDRRCSKMTDEKILGIEGGGTKTAWALVADGEVVEWGRLPPWNLRLPPWDRITKIFRVLPGEVVGFGAFLAGWPPGKDTEACFK